MNSFAQHVSCKKHMNILVSQWNRLNMECSNLLSESSMLAMVKPSIAGSWPQ